MEFQAVDSWTMRVYQINSKIRTRGDGDFSQVLQCLDL